MTSWIILVCAFLYVAILFAIAIYGDSERGISKTKAISPYIYALSLAVYCSSWTFYGAVGTAASSGWSFLPIYLGPFLVFVFAGRLLNKLVRVGKRQNTTSIADFLASRYSKKRGVAFLATLICTVAGIPYIGLQLKAVTNSLTIVSQTSAMPFNSSNTALFVAIAMIIFAILFGTRQVDASRHHHGIMLTIAFESLIKLGALIALAAYVIFYFYSGYGEFKGELQATGRFTWNGLNLSFLTQLLLAASAVLVLPRQFHVMVVENTHRSHLQTARWVFPLYLVIICIVILPITAAGLRLFQHANMNADTYVLLLPQVAEQTWLVALVFIGGFSASVAMIVITTLALSTMLSNDALFPVLIRNKLAQDSTQVATWLILMRRLIIVAVILSAWFYSVMFGQSEALSKIGLLAFSLVVQLTPALLLGLYWRKAHYRGAYAGMIAGGITWVWTLMIPMLNDAGYVPSSLIENGPWGISWLRPEQMLGFQFSDSLSHGVFFSLLFNITCLIWFSARAEHSLADRLQASAFVQLDKHLLPSEAKQSERQVRSGDLVSMLERFAGSTQTRRWISDFERVNHLRIIDNEPPSSEFIRYIERILSGVIGASSARAMIHSAVAGSVLHLEDVVTFFDETTQAIQFNQKVLSSTLENLDHGVSVIDRDLRLVAWNRKYVEMYPYPTDLLRVGTPIADLVRYNAERGECGPGEVEDHVIKRVEHLHSAAPHRFIRVRQDGSVIEIKGNPLPGGGFVTTFNDISEYVKVQNDLKEAKDNLEKRVQERTLELRNEINERERAEELLFEAKNEAELANESKTRFLALASHDILQPLNAARLYNTALLERYRDDDVVIKLEHSLKTTEELLSTLLEIAKLDGNPRKPELEPVDLNGLFHSIANEFYSLAEEKGLRLIVRPNAYFVLSESRQLRRIIQNLVSNAVKYTQQGSILLAARKRGDAILIQVWDSGLGIAEADHERIFHDFNRLDQHAQYAHGVGLGLSVVWRMSAHLGHKISVKSREGKGSCFEILTPLSNIEHPIAVQKPSYKTRSALGLTIAVIDNDQDNVDALTTLLASWGCRVVSATDAQSAQNILKPDALIIDYQLGEKLTGFSLYDTLLEQWQAAVPTILVTAHTDSDLRGQALKKGLSFLAKPVKPAALRALLKPIAAEKI
ncbi:PAS-domain containing protein [Reinekea marina]|uniref:histidine kinase n=1 Tax=Reinekea marina TaxID=1310421 RepID=A0ABV7WY67_9GAMM|nr:PAS-domain containing protein [Reinekea marina]MDN3647420.1 PAS-domain containing protein [Reinekea marina]